MHPRDAASSGGRPVFHLRLPLRPGLVALDCLSSPSFVIIKYVWHAVNPRPASDTLSIEQMSTQEDIYEKSVSPLVEAALAGYNATVFAYGQTGQCLPLCMNICMCAQTRQSAWRRHVDGGSSAGSGSDLPSLRCPVPR